MKHSYLLLGITSGRLGRLLVKNGFSFTPKTIFRIFFLAQSSLFASMFKRSEKRKLKKNLAQFEMPSDPVFIVGHWRTGSTFLHQLMSLDDQLVAPTVFQVSVPDSFLVSEKYYKPVMTKMMSPKRPMDNVALGFYEPQEDEYALIKLAPGSPLEKLVFPKNKSYFLLDYDDFIPSENVIEDWKKALRNFCKRLSYSKGKRVLLKNPFHSMRISLLRDMFPKAKFIHIHRHPYKVVPSTIHMWNVVSNENKLKSRKLNFEVQDVVAVLNRMLSTIRQQMKLIPQDAKAEISFKELQNDPVKTLKQVYHQLGLKYTTEFDAKLKARLSETKFYQKNNYVLSETDKEIIRNGLREHFKHYNYEK
ncbi:MAG: sulfotransferase [Bacteroidetes bacterium]|nr:sulfotransferase [Bacteroidota bacterium]